MSFDTIAYKDIFDPYGMIRKECHECADDFKYDTLIWLKQESTYWLCDACYKELPIK